METQKDNPQGNASLAGAEFTWKYYTGFYNKDNLPAEATRTWVTKTIAETDSDGTIHYVTKLADTYKVSGDSFYMQDGKAVSFQMDSYKFCFEKIFCGYCNNSLKIFNSVDVKDTNSSLI